MGILALAADERVAQVEVTEDELTVRLMDGRAISVPLVWYPRLLNATAEQRKNWRISGGGYGIHWPDIDEDLSAAGLLRGIPTAQKSSSAIRAHHQRDYKSAEQVQPKPVSTPDEDDSGKGLLDYLVEAEEAGADLLEIISSLGEQINDITAKVGKHGSNLDKLNKAPGALQPKKMNTIILLAASDINIFSQHIEGMLPRFERNTDILERSFSAYISHAQPEVTENLEQLIGLRESLLTATQALGLINEHVSTFRDMVQAISSQGISHAMTKATTRQSKALEGLIANIHQFESFALRIVFQIEEKLNA